MFVVVVVDELIEKSQMKSSDTMFDGHSNNGSFIIEQLTNHALITLYHCAYDYTCLKE